MSKRRDVLRQLEDDICYHIERETSENVHRGMSPEAAKYAALRRFGNVQLVKEQTREVWISTTGEQMWQDVRFGLRMLRRNGGFATIAILTLAIGIAVNTSVFSIVNTTLLRPLPYPDADRIVALSVGVTAAATRNFKPGISGADFAEWRSQTTSFDELAGYTYSDKTLAGRNVSDRVRAISVAGDFWSLVGANASSGHLFEPGKSQDEIVLSNAVFKNQFKGDRGIVGSVVTVDGKPMTIAGVLPSNFRFYFPQDWWSGLAPADAGVFVPAPPLLRSKPNRLFVVGRLKRGVPALRALAELQGVESTILKTYPDRWFPGVSHMALVPLQTQLLGANRQGLLMLQLAGLFVLLIACVNIANLLLARGAARAHEIGIRTAIGAGSLRILRQFFVEGLLLALFGGVTGFFMANGMVALFIHFGPHSLPLLSVTSIDGRVMAFAFTLCLGSSVFFGFGPAIALWNANPQSALKEGARNSSTGSGGIRIRRFLVASEIALAVVLLTGAALMLKSFRQMYTNPPGFEPDNTLVVKVALSGSQYADKTKQVSYLRESLDRLSSIPGVIAFGLANAQDYIIQSKDSANPPRVDHFRDTLVSPGYFQAVGMRLQKGRWFTATDPADATIVNETMARRMFGDRNPLGQKIDGLGRQIRVIGVVANLKYVKLDADPGPEIFRAYEPNLGGGNVNMTLAVRMPGDPLRIASTLRRKVAGVDPTQPVYDIETLQQTLSASVSVRRFEFFLLTLFAMAALLIALIGVYGVIAYSVTQRNKEIGIRIALGAQRGQVIQMIISQGLKMGSWGISIGVVAAYGFTGLMAGLLYGVKPHDPVVLWGVPVTLFFVVALASSGPALRAALINPLAALRNE